MRELVFSPKQRRVLTWWRPGSPDRDRQAILCDGAVRSGKTLCTGLSFFCWAMVSFHRKNFALCGKTIQSIGRNLLEELLPLLDDMGFRCEKGRPKTCSPSDWGDGSTPFICLEGGTRVQRL